MGNGRTHLRRVRRDFSDRRRLGDSPAGAASIQAPDTARTTCSPVRAFPQLASCRLIIVDPNFIIRVGDAQREGGKRMALVNSALQPANNPAARERRNPSWSREELILALELYLEHSGNPPGKESRPVAELSALLNQLGERLGRREQGTFRNPNGVYMKLMNFRRLDPAYLETGRSGLSRGGRLEEVVWREFADDQDGLHRVASAIRGELERPLAVEDDYGDEAEEGAIITALHRRRERNRELVRKRKQQALREHGDLRCEGCDLSFAERYGERGEGFIEVHHCKPLHQMQPGEKTRLVDLALVCANCHRMLHRRMPWLTIEELRAVIV